MSRHRNWRTIQIYPISLATYACTAAQYAFLCSVISRCIGEEMLERLKVTVLTWYLTSWEGNLFLHDKHWIHHTPNNDHKPPRTTAPLIVSAVDHWVTHRLHTLCLRCLHGPVKPKRPITMTHNVMIANLAAGFRARPGQQGCCLCLEPKTAKVPSLAARHPLPPGPPWWPL